MKADLVTVRLLLRIADLGCDYEFFAAQGSRPLCGRLCQRLGVVSQSLFQVHTRLEPKPEHSFEFPLIRAIESYVAISRIERGNAVVGRVDDALK